MNRLARLMIGALAAGLLSAGTAAAQVVTVATGAQGSLAYSSGQAIAKVANDNGITARTQPLVGYLPLINNGEVDFGFSNGVEAEYAFSGTGNYDRAHPNIRLVGVMFPLTTGIMVRADSGIHTIADLKARAGELKIASEYTSSTIIPFYIAGGLANGGMTYEDFQQVPVSSFVAGINALGDGLVDIALVSLNNGAGKQVEAKLAGQGGLEYVSLDNSEEGVKAFKEYLPAGNIVTFKANENIPGMKSDKNLMQIPWVMLTNADTPEDLVYRMTKIIAENNAALKESFGAFGNAKLEKMAPANATPYHPGALKYYEEAGITVGQ
ncbi:TAXI family TRAP transporter solute-binding subunit [Oricola thermophila]|uniref:TAXI family TRAP transporter solute-binding subunit n=1 Tax=Oricola thermophila TaxID=2742145 RepID=A0A6N1VDL8_9HYPH|nr:TAXI family TRAP transporter solute-binding subunit [Oricola thermophila]QKV18924.1 TAXI family TRAP transporter solute-binding subunit [Oricola thermophila]